MTSRLPGPIVRIAKGTFYYGYPTVHNISTPPNPPLFAKLDFELSSEEKQTWSVIGPSLSGKTALLKVLQGGLFCDPPASRTYPYLSRYPPPSCRRNKHAPFQYVGFNIFGEYGYTLFSTSYLSARYECRRDATDFSLCDYLQGKTELNPYQSKPDSEIISDQRIAALAKSLDLISLLDLPFSYLSNGQIRRAMIARALLRNPIVLLLDEPFLGLDPTTMTNLDTTLRSLASHNIPKIIISLRPQDPVPDWITHVIYLDIGCRVRYIGRKQDVLRALRVNDPTIKPVSRDGLITECTLGGIGNESITDECHSNSRSQGSSVQRCDTNHFHSTGEPLIEMDGCVIRYGNKIILGNWSQDTILGKREGLVWNVRRGERWGIFGPNGSGKTTLVSLICSDHPQAYSLPLKLFGLDRLPNKDVNMRPMTVWDIQSRIGHASPEVHRQIPTKMSIRNVIENAWANTLRSKPRLNAQSRALVGYVLSLFETELNPDIDIKQSPRAKNGNRNHWADLYTFGSMSFSAQRVALFLRAVIKAPDIVILDEAFSGMDQRVRNKCMLFLDNGARGLDIGEMQGIPTNEMLKSGLTDNQALICISHTPQECPSSIRQWMCLPASDSTLPVRFGNFRGPLCRNQDQWYHIWGI